MWGQYQEKSTRWWENYVKKDEECNLPLNQFTIKIKRGQEFV
jgi:hypothetical protein